MRYRTIPLALLTCFVVVQFTSTAVADDKDDLSAALNEAIKLRKEVKYAEAALLFEKALKLAPSVYGEDHQITATILFDLANLYADQGKYTLAEPLCQRALTIYEKAFGKEHPKVANSLNNLALLYEDQGKYALAEPLYQRAVTIYEKAFGKEHPDVARTLDNLAGLYEAQGKYALAEPLSQSALAIYEKAFGKEHPDVASSLNNLAILYNDQGKYALAEPLHQRALTIYEKAFGKEHPKVANSLNNLAKLYAEQGKYALAEPLYQRALTIYEKAFGKEHPDVANSLNNLAFMYNDQGKYALAGHLYERALAIYEKAFGKEHPKVARTLGNLANVYWAQGKYALAEPLYQRALAIYEKAFGKEHPEIANSLNNLAKLYASQGKYALAEPLYQRALAIYEKTLGQEHPFVAAPLNNLAILYKAQGKYAEAEPLFQRTLAICEKAFGKEHPDVAAPLNNLANVYRAQGKYAEAEPLYQRALTIGEKAFGKEHPDVAARLNNLAALYADQGKYAEATAAMTRMRKSIRLFLLRELPSMSAREQKQFLVVDEQNRFAFALSLGYRPSADAEVVLASASWLLNGKAIATEALAIRSSLEREIADPEGKKLLAEIQDLRSQESALALKVNTGEQRERLEARRRDLEKQLALQSATSAKIANPWVELDIVRRAIPTDGVLIDVAKFRPYRLGVNPGEKNGEDAERYVAWVIPAKGAIRIVNLGEAKPIDEAVAAAAKDMDAASQDLFGQKVGNLFKAPLDENKVEAKTVEKLTAVAKLVFDPLKPHLGTAKKLILSPDGDLWLLPWSALPVGKDRYLIEDYSLRLVISGRDLVEPAKLGTLVKPTAAVIVADPDYDLSPTRGKDENTPRGLSQDVNKIPHAPRLPGTMVEARAAYAKLKNAFSFEPKVYRQAEATKGIVKATKSPELLALMTHGFFLKKQEVDIKDDKGFDLGGEKRALPALKDRDGKEVENPLLRCGLLFAGANRRTEAKAGEDDGVLTGLEIVSLDLRGTKVVILSACETALGEPNTGEGVAGMRQAFQLAGAESVLATLWQINDEATVRLMGPFYDQLAKSSDRAEALTLAQRKFIEERRKRYGAAHPYFWAAFTLTGK